MTDNTTLCTLYALRSVLDTRFSHLIFLPIIDNIINSKNRKRWIIALLLVFWLWPLAFQCSHSGNLFMRATSGVGIHMMFMFVTMYFVNRFIPVSGVFKYLVAGILAYVLTTKLHVYVTFVIPIVEITLL